MKMKSAISSIAAAAMLVTSAFGSFPQMISSAAFAEGTTEQFEYSVPVKPYDMTVEESDYSDSKLALIKDTVISVTGVTTGVTTFGELKELYSGITVEEPSFDGISDSRLTQDDFAYNVFVQTGTSSSDWSGWYQTDELSLDFSSISGVSDTDVVQRIAFRIYLKDEVLTNLGLALGDTITINSNVETLSYYEYEFEPGTYDLNVTAATWDNESGLSCSTDFNIYVPDVTYHETTVGELKELYGGISVSGYSFEDSTVEGMTEADLVPAIIVYTDNWSYNAVYNNFNASFDDILSKVSDDVVVNGIRFAVSVQDGSFDALGLVEGDTFSLALGEGAVIEEDDEDDGAWDANLTLDGTTLTWDTHPEQNNYLSNGMSVYALYVDDVFNTLWYDWVGENGEYDSGTHSMDLVTVFASYNFDEHDMKLSVSLWDNSAWSSVGETSKSVTFKYEMGKVLDSVSVPTVESIEETDDEYIINLVNGSDVYVYVIYYNTTYGYYAKSTTSSITYTIKKSELSGAEFEIYNVDKDGNRSETVTFTLRDYVDSETWDANFKYEHKYFAESYEIAVEESQYSETGMSLCRNVTIPINGVVYGQTTFGELKKKYSGVIADGVYINGISDDRLTEDDFVIDMFMQTGSRVNDWSGWYQTESLSMSFSDITDVADTDLVQNIGFRIFLKDESLTRLGLCVGDTVTINTKSSGLNLYEYKFKPGTYEFEVLEDAYGSTTSGMQSSVDFYEDIPGVTFGETTVGELKKLYGGITINGYYFAGSSVEGLTGAYDVLPVIVVYTSDSDRIFNATYNCDMIFDVSLNGIDDNEIITGIHFSAAVDEDTFEKVGLKVGDKFTVTFSEAPSDVYNLRFEDTALVWDEYSGAASYEVEISDGTNTVTDYCLSNNSTNYKLLMANAGFDEGEYTITVCAVKESGARIRLGTIDYSYATASVTTEDGNSFVYDENADGTITVIGANIKNGDVVIPDKIDGKTVTEIGDNAFAAMENIETVTVPEGVKKLGWYAFNYCTNLTKVTLPSTLEYIDSWAFERCYKLQTINVPANVSTINGGAFAQNDSLTSITCDKNSKYFTSVNGVLFTKDMKALVAYPGGIKGSYTVPASVNHIGDAAFYGAKGLTAVEILGNLDFIGFEAFAECAQLKDVKINEGVTYVGYWAFRGCSGIKQLTVPQSVTNIGNEAFGFADYDSTKYGDFTLRGYKDSAVYYYALRHSIPFISIGAASDENRPFEEKNIKETAVVTNPDAKPEDKITDIKVNPSFNIKDKNDAGASFDLDKISIEAKEVYAGDDFDRLENALGDDRHKHHNIIDLSLFHDGKDISDGYDGLVEVTVPIPEGHKDKEFRCYRLYEKDGVMEKELIPGKRVEDNYVMYLEHFSTYALVADDEHTHDYGTNWENDADSHWHECSCGEKTEIAAHTESDWIIDQAATTTEAGSKHTECSVCGYIIKTETIAKKASTTSSSSASGGKTSSRSSTSRSSSSSTSTTASTTSAPSIAGGISGWSAITDEIAKAAAGSALTVNLDGSTEIPAAVIAAIAASKATVEFKLSDKAAWIADGSVIEGIVASVKAGVTVGGNSIAESVLNTVETGLETVQVKFDNAGKFADGMKLKVNLGKSFADKFANVYRVNGDSLEFVGVCAVNADGTAVLPVDSAEDYAIIVDDISRLAGDADNNMAVNTLDASAILKHIVGIDVIGDKKLSFTDFNGDGTVNGLDASAILKYAVA